MPKCKRSMPLTTSKDISMESSEKGLKRGSLKDHQHENSRASAEKRTGATYSNCCGNKHILINELRIRLIA